MSDNMDMPNDEELCKSNTAELDADIVQSKRWRMQLDFLLQEIKEAKRKSRSRSLAITHLEDVIMRLGMDLKEMNTSNPYPNSYDPSNTKIDPTADGLKL